MSGFDRALLGEFSAELLEHVAACEAALVGSEPLSEPDVHRILRGIHSIKSLARVLGATNFETVAHRAESIVVSVRDGKRTFDPATQHLLLKAIDAFKEARESILRGEDFYADESLLLALSQAIPQPAAKRPIDGVAETAMPVEDDDVFSDHETLVALAEVIEELLPSVVAALTAARTKSDVATRENIAALEFALGKAGLTTLQKAFADLRKRAEPIDVARCLFLVHGFARLVGRDCGLGAAAAVARPWLGAAALAALGKLRWDELEWLLRALWPESPFAALLPQMFAESCSEALREQCLGIVAQALRAELATGVRAEVDVATLALDSVRILLEQEHAVPADVLRSLDARRVDLRRFQTVSSRSILELQEITREGFDLFEIVLPGVNTDDGLAQLALALTNSFPILTSESMVVDGAPTLVLLIAGRVSDDRIRARLADLVGAAKVTLRKLDDAPGDAHFRAKTRPITDEIPMQGEHQVRVPVGLLDSMFGRIGQFFSITTRFNALVLDSEMQDTLTELSDYCVLRAPELLPKVGRLMRQQSEYATLEAEVHRLITLIHEMTLGLRVIPMDTLFSRFPRMVHDLAHEQGKQVRLETKSNGIRVDNGMLQLLADPLVHMIRNSIDHGIELPAGREKEGKQNVATIALTAEQRGNRIIIEVKDDGQGIDIERVLERAIARNLVAASTAATLTEEQIARFIFSPGFSTAPRITETSGRGVGMDVALVNVTKLGGALDIVTQRGRGTTFRIDIPLSKAIQSMLLAETGIQTVAFPERMVSECVVVHSSDVQSVNGQRSMLLRDRFLPLFSVGELLKLPAPPTNATASDLSIVVCEIEGRRVGFEVRRVRRRTDLLVQEMHPRIARIPGIGGISTIGTDKIVIVIDPEGLLGLVRRSAVFGLRTHAVRVAEGLF